MKLNCSCLRLLAVTQAALRECTNGGTEKDAFRGIQCAPFSPSSCHTNDDAQPESFHVQARRLHKGRNIAILQQKAAVAGRLMQLFSARQHSCGPHNAAAIAQRNKAVVERDAAINQLSAAIAEA